MSSTTEETLQTLPPGDPEGGHTTHDTSPVFQTGTVPDVEQQAYDEREATREAQEQAVAEHEDEVAKERDAEAEPLPEEPPATQTAKKSSSDPSTSSSSSSSRS